MSKIYYKLEIGLCSRFQPLQVVYSSKLSFISNTNTNKGIMSCQFTCIEAQIVIHDKPGLPKYPLEWKLDGIFTALSSLLFVQLS